LASLTGEGKGKEEPAALLANFIDHNALFQTHKYNTTALGNTTLSSGSNIQVIVFLSAILEK
jgi:hypothetical protein